MSSNKKTAITKTNETNTTPKTNDATTTSNNTTTSMTNDSNTPKTNDSNAPTTNDSNAFGVVIPVGYVPRSYSPRSCKYKDKVDHSLDSYMWYSTGDADCSDQDDYDP
ncbi:hypothetical protein F8M41_002612 [Gigaspora margarita]|uniref:Uncharacterized protein n=1 Tax=Gigaspora margarita TaxID=4874 RepID=A0A8H3XCM2_GIGMA|nr:hypothetical protein F8M41_002612 [Gigaspora margarita]